MRQRGGHAWTPTTTERSRSVPTFPGGFEERFDALAAIAYRVAFRVRGERAEAEDIAQETLARALVRWVRIAGYAEAWTATTASNLAISAWRRQQRADRRAGDLGCSVGTVKRHAHRGLGALRLALDPAGPPAAAPSEGTP